MPQNQEKQDLEDARGNPTPLVRADIPFDERPPKDKDK